MSSFRFQQTLTAAVPCLGRPACLSLYARCRARASDRRPGRTPRRASLQKVFANPSDVYVFNLEGVICEEDGQVYGDSQQLQSFEAPFYVTSSLQAEKASELLRAAGVKLAADSPQLFAGLDTDNTIETIAKITQRPVVKETGARLNFLTGSGKALQLAQSNKQLDKVRLYLAAWSREGQEFKGKLSTVSELDEKQFTELLSWGLIMGVDDGCGDDN